MEAHLLARAVSRCSISSAARRLVAVPEAAALSLRPPARRHKSTTSRTKRALNIAPHPSFLAPEPQQRIVFNPPASAASVYHTPFKFLPKSDPRRRANLTALFGAAGLESPPAAAPAELPPRLHHEYYAAKKRHLSPEDVAEMRRLRALDPVEWSVLRLANKYDCSPIFVMLAVRASPEHRARTRERLEDVKRRWGPIRTKAREDRRKRQDMLLRGEL